MQNTLSSAITKAGTSHATSDTTTPMRKVAAAILLGLATLTLTTTSQATVSMPVPGAQTADGNKVLTFVAKDPPGVRCNGNLQVAVEIANVYQVPIQLVPSSLVPQLPAPAVFYGNEMIAADGKDHNGGVSYAIVSDVMEIEGVPKQAKTGLIGNANVRERFDSLKASIKNGGN
ncbi:MAG: hypothetical protein LRY56_00575 [Burkholderiaceae bacterium]|nr:hypothetical protein [Burkholderiaceae bacterium]MCD8517648.1 hypothetical protein [Burkholderiaceae bacterium]MCD8536075.1 hypothetical protein [Burkholderiaceae bacterium]